MAPVLSALVDGEATAEQIASVRPHLRTCLACRARLVEYRDAPARVAALVPVAAFAAGASGGGLRSLAESVHQLSELAVGQKAAAVAASAAAIAGGGVASVDGLAGRPIEPAARQMQPAPSRAKASEPPAPPVVIAPPSQPEPPAVPSPAPAPRAAGGEGGGCAGGGVCSGRRGGSGRGWFRRRIPRRRLDGGRRWRIRALMNRVVN